MGFFSKPKRNEDDSFMDHLEELRDRIIKALLYSIGGMFVCAIFSDFLVNEVLLYPMRTSAPNTKLQNLVPYGQISLYLQVIVFSGLILCFPIIIHQIWAFVKPGLTPKERAGFRFVVLFLSVCFFSGVAFGYFAVIPVSLQFFAGFGSPYVENNIAINEYISFFIGTILTSGLIFELPFVAYVLSKLGMLTPAFMRKIRKYAFVVNLIIAAVVTPSSDAVTMMVVAIPMTLLYELSILVSYLVERKAKQDELKENKNSR